MNEHKKRSRKNALSLIVLAMLISFTYLILRQPLWIFHRQELREGNLIVTRVEAFRAVRHRLPDNLEEVGTPHDRIFYQKVDDRNYVIWFGLSLGESEVYDSSARRWQ